jgi:hypothetical protein
MVKKENWETCSKDVIYAKFIQKEREKNRRKLWSIMPDNFQN